MEAVRLYQEQQEGLIEFDIYQAAKYCGVHDKTIRRWVNERGLTNQMKNGKQYTIKKVDLDRFIRRDIR
jgi:excisionase family DNA binding protein